MNSSEHPRAYGYQPPQKHGFHSGKPAFPRPHVMEDTLKEETLQVERKGFALALKENDRGRFLRISEITSAGHSTIIVPSTGLADFQRLLDEMIRASDTLPNPHEPHAAQP